MGILYFSSGDDRESLFEGKLMLKNVMESLGPLNDAGI